MKRCLPLLALLACSDPLPPATEVLVASPRAKAKAKDRAKDVDVFTELVIEHPVGDVSGPWTAIMVRLPTAFRQPSVQMALDGAPFDEPVAVVRPRADGKGGGHDWFGTLPLRDLSTGGHTLTFRATSQGEALNAETTFQVVRSPHHVQIRVRDSDGEPVHAKIMVVEPNGEVVYHGENPEAVDRKRRDRNRKVVFAMNGDLDLYLESGEYRVHAVRGVRDSLDVQPLTLPTEPSGEPVVVALTVDHVVPTPSEVTADLHVHTAHSGDCFVPHRPRFHSLAAAGLDVVVTTDHGSVWDPAVLTEIDGVDEILVIPGAEYNLHGHGKRVGIGHINAIPQLRPVAMGKDPDNRVAEDLARIKIAYRAAPYDGVDDVLLQLNHPRGIQFWPYHERVKTSHALFNVVGFNEENRLDAPNNAWLLWPEPENGTRAIDFDALEVVNRFSWDGYITVRRDAHAFWSQGFMLTATGNSDSHALQVELAGLPVNLVSVRGRADEVTTPAFIDAVRSGAVSVSTGPIVHLEVNGANPGELVSVTDGHVRIQARVQAPPWVPTPELRIIRNGERLHTEALPHTGTGEETLDRTFHFSDTFTSDGWVTVEAGWPLTDQEPDLPEPYRVVAPGYVPLAFTNPVRVDADGDGEWTPPGL